MQGVDYKLVELKQKFKEYYDRELRHKYEELEPIRWRYLKTFWLRFGMCCCVFLFLYMYFTIFASDSVPFVYILYLISFSFAILFCSIPVLEFKKATKCLVMTRVLNYLGEFKYAHDKAFISRFGPLISRKNIENSALFGKNCQQKQDDAFKGKYHNVEIEVSEQQIEYGMEDHKQGKIFTGVLIALHLNEKYVGKIIVQGKVEIKNFIYKMFFGEKSIRTFGGGVSDAARNVLLISFSWTILLIVLSGFVWFLFHGVDLAVFICIFFIFYILIVPFFVFLVDKIDIRKLFCKEREKVQLEDVLFSKEWEVAADDQVEARFLLTPAFMERMLAVKKLFHGNRIDFSFWENNLLIAVHTNKDMFETTSLFKSALDYKKVEEVICQMYSIFSVIDELKLQRKGR